MDLRKLIGGDDSAHQGWDTHSVAGLENLGLPGFAYTVGLVEQRLPELLVLGIAGETAQELMRNAVREMRRAGVPKDGQYSDQLANMRLCYRVLPLEAAARYMVHATRRYRKPLHALQIVWPDPAGRFPWDANCVPRMAEAQSLIVDWRRHPPGPTLH